MKLSAPFPKKTLAPPRRLMRKSLGEEDCSELIERLSVFKSNNNFQGNVIAVDSIPLEGVKRKINKAPQPEQSVNR